MKSRIQKVLERVSVGIAILVFGLAIFIGITGKDFGRHWDEIRILESTIEQWEEGKLIPGWYNYPSLPFDLGILVRLSYDLDDILPGSIGDETARESLIYRVRYLFIFIAFSSIVTVFFLGRKLSGKVWPGLAGALLLAFSFEYGYHSRWIAPDTLMAAFTILAIYFAARYRHATRRRDLILAAVAGAFAAGCKYPGGWVLLPLLIAVWQGHYEGKKFAFKQLLEPAFRNPALLMTGIFILIFLITTPGALLEPRQFINDIRYEVSHYQEGHGRHTVSGFGDHALKMLMYLALYGLSSYKVLAVIISLFVLAGVVLLFRKERRLAFFLCSYPLAYMLYFMTQKAMIVRNYMVLIPFLALFAGYGFYYVMQWLNDKFRPAVWTLAGLLLVSVGMNAYDSLKAAQSIHQLKTPIEFVAELHEYINQHPQQSYLFSQGAHNFWQNQYGAPIPANVILKPGIHKDAQVVFFSREFEKYWRYYQINRPDYAVRIIGSRDINFNYYPEWPNEKIVIMKAKYARRLPITYPDVP